MADWKKVVVSGSSAELSALAVDGTITANSFTGDGSNLTGVQASGLNIDGFTDGTGITVVATDRLLLSDAGTEKYIEVSQLGGTLVTTSAVTSAGALMDSEVTNLAQVKAFDSTDYATAAQGARADSALQDITGESVTDLSDVTSAGSGAIITTAERTKLNGIQDGAEVNVDTNITVSEGTTTVEIQSSTGTNDSIAAATTAKAGVMTAADKTKLDGIASSADNYGSFNIGDGLKTKDILSGAKVTIVGSGATNVEFSDLTSTFTVTSTDTNTTYSAGNGISLSGTTFSVAAGDGLTQNASGLSVDGTVLRTTGDSVVSGSAQVAMTGDVTGTAAATTVAKVQGVALTSQEMTQVANIGSTTISATQWGYVGGANQAVKTTDSPTFVGGTFTGDVSVAGDLVVQGDLTSLQTTNLNVEDQFILINSGSATAKDAGFIFANRTAGSGQSFFYDTETNRPAWATEVAWNATAVDPTSYIPRVFDTDAGHAPIAERGSIKVSGGDVFIYA